MSIDIRTARRDDGLLVVAVSLVNPRGHTDIYHEFEDRANCSIGSSCWGIYKSPLTKWSFLTTQWRVEMNKTHYIAMSGDHGCIPDHCDVYPDKQGAQEDLIDLFSLGRAQARELRECDYIELSPGKDGASYAEIVPCSCGEPWIHQDGMTRKQFIRECGQDFGLED